MPILSELLQPLPRARLPDGDSALSVAAIHYDSRQVTPGSLFVAIAGFKVDGASFVPDAVSRGAVAVVAETEVPLPDGVALVTVPDAREALAWLSAAFYGHPSRNLRVIGITGTDGKTTTSYLAGSVLQAGGLKYGRLGTVDVEVAGRTEVNLSRQTTPEAPEIQALLREMVDAGCTHAVIESTSHGLALHRLTGIEYDVAVLTNITTDHLDFHGTQEEYVAAKRRLFELLDAPTTKPAQRYAVLNADDPISPVFVRHFGAPAVTYGLREPADLRAEAVRLSADGSQFRLEATKAPSGKPLSPGRGVEVREGVEVHSHLPAEFNVYNCLAAAGVGLAEGIDLEPIARGLGSLKGVPGRMERIDEGQPFTVVVDYAHTGDSVAKALRVLRPLTEGRLIIVFGCAGERDRSRRTGVGGAAAELADYVVLTSEDPRTEDPDAIIEEIAGVLRAKGRVEGVDFERHEDRRQAIIAAFRKARAGDTVLLAGKGHEQSMIYGAEKRPWDDRQVAREELARITAKPR
jgi:UDP-N-acetylmuramoyl-L-alanyl-D-glutamate--2,6-diaminopimelate ligase